eukprot:85492_1
MFRGVIDVIELIGTHLCQTIDSASNTSQSASDLVSKIQKLPSVFRCLYHQKQTQNTIANVLSSSISSTTTSQTSSQSIFGVLVSPKASQIPWRTPIMTYITNICTSSCSCDNIIA